MSKTLFYSLLLLLPVAAPQQANSQSMSNNPLLCDPKTGICEIPGSGAQASNHVIQPNNKPVKIIYFTDPICSSCWGIEPQLRKLKLEYGPSIEIDYRMGGLLPDWNYNSGGISKPSDVAHHWDEVSQYYQMPIDGNVWLEDPLHSSYPPSIAFKAAQLQDEAKAIHFLRRIREMVFLEKKNITKWEHLAEAASQAGLELAQFKQDYEGRAKDLFRADLDLAAKSGVRGFPTLFFTNTLGKREMVYGFKPYADMEQAIARVYPGAEKLPYDKSWQGLFAKYPTLTTREFAELSGQALPQSLQQLEGLAGEKELTKQDSKNGPLWKRNK